MARKNVTFSVDEEVLAAARAAAHKLGTSLTSLIRDHLKQLAGASANNEVDELLTLFEQQPGRSGGAYRWSREDAYSDRT